MAWFCTTDEALTKSAAVEKAYTALAQAALSSAAAGKIQTSDALLQQIGNFGAHAKIVLSGATTSCDIVDASEGLIKELDNLGIEWARRVGGMNPVKTYSAFLDQKEIGMMTLIKWGIIVGIGYFGYRWIKEATAASPARANSDYPKARLPRYAGGKRRR